MALLVGGAVFTIEKVREKRAEKKAKKKHNADRYAELERETWGNRASPEAERSKSVQEPTKAASNEEEKRRGSFESDHEGTDVVREVEARLRSASLSSPGKAPQKIQRKTTGEALWGT